jgi:N-acetylneuraminate synthase
MNNELQNSFDIGDHRIGRDRRVFVIAEAGVNHNGDIDLAKQLIDKAARAGADAVKFQTFKADAVVTREAPKAEYQLRTTGNEESQFEMLRRLELSEGAHYELKAYCAEANLMFLSTPFDEDAADFLEELGVAAFKISSGDLTNLPLLEHIARKGKPVILSTGMSDLEEVESAVTAMQHSGCDRLALLHCVSNYPADPKEINLRAMRTMEERFQIPVGFSDHSQGIDISLAAVALGACIVEKHFTIDRNLPGPDHQASLTPNELVLLVEGIRKVELALGDGKKRPAPSEIATARIARRSLTAAQNISSGSRLAREMIALKRPGTGMPPSELASVIGKTALRDIREGELLDREMFN